MSTSLTLSNEATPTAGPDLNALRRHLANLWRFHGDVASGRYKPRPGQRDFYADLESAYSKIFPGRRLEGSVPRPGFEEQFAEPWFIFYDGHRQYELSELSGGERAIFPLLFDFVNWHIHRSVILIDELELHLHPPMQQALLNALAQLGEDNQFIVTTHSRDIEEIVPEENIVRLESD
jgi:predicted ATPase